MFAEHFDSILLSDHQLPAIDPPLIRYHESYSDQPAFWEQDLLPRHQP